jgi:hypothetical protein
MLTGSTWRLRNLAACIGLVLMVHGCEGCPPVTLKTLELRPANVATGTSGVAGSFGYCTSAGEVPPAPPFGTGAGEIKVGFDDFFRYGSDPFPCHDLRNSIFRGGVRFDLGQFDNIVSAELLFDTVRSMSRAGGGPIINEAPPVSHAATLSVATQAFTSQMLADDDAFLPLGLAINIGVSSQVRDWVSKSRPNFGFVFGGPRGPVSSASMFRDSDAMVTIYGNFRLKVLYNPALNPRAPQ